MDSLSLLLLLTLAVAAGSANARAVGSHAHDAVDDNGADRLRENRLRARMLRAESIRQSLLNARSVLPAAAFEDHDDVASPPSDSPVAMHDISAMSSSDIAAVEANTDEPAFVVLPQSAAAAAVSAVAKISADLDADADAGDEDKAAPFASDASYQSLKNFLHSLSTSDAESSSSSSEDTASVVTAQRAFAWLPTAMNNNNNNNNNNNRPADDRSPRAAAAGVAFAPRATRIVLSWRDLQDLANE